MSGKSILHWWMQRMTAVVMLPVPIFLVKALLVSDFATGLLDLTHGYKGALTALFLMPAFYHGVLGVQVVLEDYVRSDALRAFLITFIKLFAVLTVCVFSLVVLLRTLGM
ncbi:succinate dehydrogenase, hydrophobic membrane anchor protein [Anaplasma phagocytophilum]|uniref:Succinate dehydrogenase hydrophobic membrane anchor subunit n=4 Tax=Anaplasma phagocytophilum TaxID=948 RepID=Q79S38_ANAPH|nr:succinate dehydrogenase, hydrophobic membrane anchor protein [Anaplasma phagocytophilum]AAS89250.1 succinate dehydrogenase subunit D [Anaplasma phagocytophilum]ABD44059.1 succinate dehydrogenase, hydrophobic membrane anchor protein [Anaplasma phagocytophilum str. HZ]EOA61240.2 succinate dehyrdrogenase subunit D [Anaplasma phagocytophilum str. HGE1]KJV62987.1 succinate dehydrogenase, hydrophobic membrane anchor protein [Anaplasma phagocytophilum str. NCH-1]PLC10409.1 succinate dehydrogenase,